MTRDELRKRKNKLEEELIGLWWDLSKETNKKLKVVKKKRINEVRKGINSIEEKIIDSYWNTVQRSRGLK